jgi:choloylglycine hydrolase
MDWSEDMQANLWLFPQGMKRDGAAGPNSLKWTSKYGSVVVSAYEAGSADGINEKGLVANMLYLVESEYGPTKNPNAPRLSIAAWAQYVLDNFATVKEAVDALSKEPFQIVAPVLPNGAPAQLHLAISDSSGDSAIFEYIQKQLYIHHGKQYQVMTNSPTYNQQLALNTYWQEIGGTTFLPGTSRAADRFVRASFFISALPTKIDPHYIPTKIDPHYIKAVPGNSYANQALASVVSVMRSVSVPLGITTPNQPNIASTLWRTVADQKNRMYYFDSATSPNIFRVELAKLDFKAGAPVKKLTVANGPIYAGDVSKYFVASKPFAFLPAGVEVAAPKKQ